MIRMYRETGETLGATNNLREAAEMLRNALTAAQELASRDPANAQWQGELAAGNLVPGQTLAKVGNSVEAKDKLLQNREILTHLQHCATLTREQKGWLIETENALAGLP